MLRLAVVLLLLLPGCLGPVEQTWIDIERTFHVDGDDLRGTQVGAHCGEVDVDGDDLTVWHRDGRDAPRIITQRFHADPDSDAFATTGLEALAAPWSGGSYDLRAMFGEMTLATLTWDDGLYLDGAPFAGGTWNTTYAVQGAIITETITLTIREAHAAYRSPGTCE